MTEEPDNVALYLKIKLWESTYNLLTSMGATVTYRMLSVADQQQLMHASVFYTAVQNKQYKELNLDLMGP